MPIVVGFSICFLVGLIAIGLFQHKHLNQLVEQRTRTLGSQIDAHIYHEYQHLLQLARAISSSDGAEKAMVNEDVVGLKKTAETALHFFGLNQSRSLSFYSNTYSLLLSTAHKSQADSQLSSLHDMSGGELIRLMQQAELDSLPQKNLIPQKRLEHSIGGSRYSEIEIQVIFPWESQGELLGFVVAQRPIDSVLSANREMLFANTHPSLDAMYVMVDGSNPNFYDKAIQSVVYSSKPLLPEQNLHSLFLTANPIEFEKDQKQFITTTLPVVGKNTNELGRYVAIFDVTDQHQGFLWQKGFFIAVLVLMALVKLWFVQRRMRLMGRQLVDTSRELEHEIIRHKRSQLRLEQQRFFDDLTGLPNRKWLLEKLQDVTEDVGDAASHNIAVMFVDIDRFKDINDSQGHDCGDLLIQALAERLTDTLRQVDSITRFGGDEFVIISNSLSPSIAHARLAAAMLAQNIMAATLSPLEVGDKTFRVSVSVGIAMYPSDATNPEDILKYADAAMYQAKLGGRSRFAFFEPHMHKSLTERMVLEEELAAAAGNNQLHLHYQPKFDGQKKLRGAEALLRWHHPTLGSVSPEIFIPVAEDSGIIEELGRWVLWEAVGQCKSWQRMGMLPEGFRLAVNVSPEQFRGEFFTDELQTILLSHDLDPKYLIIEITESSLLEDFQDARSKIQIMKGWGIKVSIDDFGTGYSSLAYLNELDVDELKIDRSFIRSIESNEDSRTIVDALLSLAKHLNIQTVAEGVETQGQWEYLTNTPCALFQGYFLGKPAPAERWFIPGEDVALNLASNDGVLYGDMRYGSVSYDDRPSSLKIT
ncbi:hypothetical protein GCM10007877_13310 [Marinibactrum halimedae]|uniref:EAL domain-containing protein n=2 Tax=Marinibactrum halimedae TaxID=1444977 RepID=A0AA37TAA9_9GAMM|nr:hypothetical protein GCM10007877_13310 [Marinibactrum halimedae]